MAASASAGALRTTAYVKDGELTIVAINNSASAMPTSFALAGVPCGEQVVPVVTSATDTGGSWRRCRSQAAASRPGSHVGGGRRGHGRHVHRHRRDPGERHPADARVVVKVGAGGKVSFFNEAGTVHLIADITGYHRFP